MNKINIDMSEIEGKNILITGGSGFIGRHLVESLIGKCNLIISSHRKIEGRNIDRKNAKLIELQLEDFDEVNKTLKDIDIVFHLAAEIGYPGEKTKPLGMYRSNTMGSLSLLEACRSNDVRLVYSSSMAVYGTPKYLPVDEKHPKNPKSFYGASKLGGEYYCLLFNELYSIETTVLRYSTVYGPGMDRRWVTSIFFKRALEDKPLTIYGSGESTSDFVFVEDVVQANLFASLKNKAIGEDFNIGSGAETSLKELAEQIIQITNKGNIAHDYTKDEKIKRFRFDISKAKKILNYNPQFNLVNGLSLCKSLNKEA